MIAKILGGSDPAERLLVEPLPERDAEGLLALLRLLNRGRLARISPGGEPILLDEQNCDL
ncbi:hypothetical protein [Methylocaldum szegediense]|uniref:Uncharacterized protein n=1 Tax=Methylocaldum szegediense TaxID=73780 RepID=A0ABN8X866_9GAMM|nr:hypothetical protein [Methylocaldum szegediense]CAI8935938.1 protein of unknown function [Methylocaldum szegediense]